MFSCFKCGNDEAVDSHGFHIIFLLQNDNNSSNSSKCSFVICKVFLLKCVHIFLKRFRIFFSDYFLYLLYKGNIKYVNQLSFICDSGGKSVVIVLCETFMLQKTVVNR